MSAPSRHAPTAAATTREECWVITNGAAGNERQALALAEAMPWPIRSLTLVPHKPWSWLAPRLIPGAHLAWPRATRDQLTAPWPRLAIGCGRSAALFTRLLRLLSEGRCRSVQILDPRIDPRHWDLVVAPAHDQLHGPNVLNPIGSLNPVDDAWLADSRQAWSHLGQLPGPRLAILLGGPRHGHGLDRRWMERFTQAVRCRHQRDGGSVLLLASRRTPETLFAALRAALEGAPGIRWAGPVDGANPYPGVLAWADRLIVTPDSVNMLSEACATGRPVHTLAHTEPNAKLARLHANLTRRGLVHELSAQTAEQQPPLRETAAIAAQLCTRLGIEPAPGT